jgi:hypothetical protein
LNITRATGRFRGHALVMAFGTPTWIAVSGESSGAFPGYPVG